MFFQADYLGDTDYENFSDAGGNDLLSSRRKKSALGLRFNKKISDVAVHQNEN